MADEKQEQPVPREKPSLEDAIERLAVAIERLNAHLDLASQPVGILKAP